MKTFDTLNIISPLSGAMQLIGKDNLGNEGKTTLNALRGNLLDTWFTTKAEGGEMESNIAGNLISIGILQMRASALEGRCDDLEADNIIHNINYLGDGTGDRSIALDLNPSGFLLMGNGLIHTSIFVHAANGYSWYTGYSGQGQVQTDLQAPGLTTDGYLHVLGTGNLNVDNQWYIGLCWGEKL